jgi:hypothetical protein
MTSLSQALRDLSELTNRQLSASLRLALALSRDEQKLTAFFHDPFWKHKRPNRRKLLLACLQFALPPRSTRDRKQLSKYAAAVTWLVIRGYGPDDLTEGVKKEGGRAQCARKLAAWRAEQKKISAEQKDRTIRRETLVRAPAKSVVHPDAATADATSGAPRLPVGFAPGLRQWIKDREPPADREFFWARVRHRGKRIRIVRIAAGKSNRPPKALKKKRKSK